MTFLENRISVGDVADEMRAVPVPDITGSCMSEVCRRKRRRTLTK